MNNVFIVSYDIGCRVMIMSKLREAAALSLDKWAQELDNKIPKTSSDENENPCFRKSPEQMKVEAQAIWEKAHS